MRKDEFLGEQQGGAENDGGIRTDRVRKGGHHHARAICGTENAKLLAISAKSAESCRCAREECGVDTYPDYRRLLERRDIECVNIVAPTHLHKSMAIDALESGKHVLLEKPMAISIEGCDDILRAFQEARRLLYVGFELRVSTLWARMKEIAESGEQLDEGYWSVHAQGRRSLFAAQLARPDFEKVAICDIRNGNAAT